VVELGGGGLPGLFREIGRLGEPQRTDLYSEFIKVLHKTVPSTEGLLRFVAANVRDKSVAKKLRHLLAQLRPAGGLDSSSSSSDVK
jgi:hypothetical protein